MCVSLLRFVWLVVGGLAWLFVWLCLLEWLVGNRVLIVCLLFWLPCLFICLFFDLLCVAWFGLVSCCLVWFGVRWLSLVLVWSVLVWFCLVVVCLVVFA